MYRFKMMKHGKKKNSPTILDNFQCIVVDKFGGFKSYQNVM